VQRDDQLGDFPFKRLHFAAISVFVELLQPVVQFACRKRH